MAEYFTFTPGEEAYLNEINRVQETLLSPYAARSEDAVRARPHTPNFAILRPPCTYDVDKIIHSPLYNRYSDKTQVFSFYRNDDLSRRALHVQFVSKIAKTIGRALKLNLELIEAISLGHDMGHPPFGHKGELFLSEKYQEGCQKRQSRTRYFSHNVHSVRIFHQILDRNLTLQTLSGILSHNGEKTWHDYAPTPMTSFEAFDDVLEQCYLDETFHKSLRPNTLEGCVVRLSDMIAYAGKDRQDLYKARLIPEQTFQAQRLIGTTNSQVISNVMVNLIKNSIDSPTLNMDEAVFQDLRDLIHENAEVIYSHPELNGPYFEIVRPLMGLLYDRLVEDVVEQRLDSPVFRHYLNDPIQGACYRDPRDREQIIAPPDEIVTDFIASMTDDYFIDICRHLHLNDPLLDTLRYKEYFDF